MPREGAPCNLVLSHGDVLMIEEHEHRRKDETLPARRATVIVAVLCRGAPGQRRRIHHGHVAYHGYGPKSLDPRAVDALRRLADQVIRLLHGDAARPGGALPAQARDRGPVGGQFHSQSSIMFTDFVGFTRHTETLEPAELLETLAR